MDAIVLAGPTRTPQGKFGGKLSGLAAPELAAAAIRESVARAGLRPEDVDYVVLGNVLSAGLGQAPARQAALLAGLPESASAMVVNQVCASGMMAVAVAAQMVQSGMARVVVAGGMESMSRAPHLLMTVRNGVKLGNVEAVDSLVYDGLTCAIEHQHMGDAAEAIARQHGVSRAEQDAFALRSHERAVAAHAEGTFRDEIVAVATPGRGERVMVEADEGPRADTSAEALAGLRPAFEAAGSVTAGNASQISDGASAVVVMSEATAKERGATAMARIVDATYAGIAPRRLFEAPVEATRKLLKHADWRLDTVDLIEINEAYAAQTLANGKALDWDWERVNVKGGAVALGHPIGASGARILVTLLHSLQQRNAQRGAAVVCHGGGGAAAMAVERV